MAHQKQNMSLTEDQLTRFLEHIDYPMAKHAADPLHRLQQLMLHHIARVPFDNVGIHYSRTHKLSLQLDDLYNKIVQRSKGGYCHEVNTLFAAVLRGLGYTVLTIAGRVRAGGDMYLGWNHMCLLVAIDGTRYLVDVGYGDSAMQPVPLVSGTEFAIYAPRRGKIEYRGSEFHTDSAQRLWIYSTCDSVDDSLSWAEQYCFVEMEFLPFDYECMNYYTSTNPDSFFMPHIVAMRLIVEEDKDGSDGDVRIAGILTYFKEEVRKRVEGSMERAVVQTVATEAERIEALEKWFRIPLSEEDRQGIFTTALALDK